jgi:hypothetical protein
MATNGGTIEIDVELKGTADIREGIGSISQAGKTLVDTMGSTNEKLAEGLGEVGESIFGLGDSLAELKGGISNLGTTGAAGFMSLLGPIGAVVSAGFALYEVYKLISGAAQEAEENQSAMAAAASDLQSKLEALAEKGVRPSAEELQKFSLITIRAQIAKEKLQFAQEKLTKVTIAAYEADEKARKAKDEVRHLEESILATTLQVTIAKRASAQATEEQAEANKKLAQAMSTFRSQQEAASKLLKEGAKEEKELEERSAEFLKGKVKENIEKLKALKLMEQENNLTEDSFKLAQLQIERESALAIIQVDKNEENAKALLKQNEELERKIKKIDQVALVEEVTLGKTIKLEDELRKKRDEERAKRQAEMNKRRLEQQAREEKEKQIQLKLIAEQARIRQLEIEGEKDSNEKLLKLAKHRYDTALRLAKENANQRKIAELTYSNEVANIQRQAQAKRDAELRVAVENEMAFKRETALFNINQIENDFIRESELLDFKYQKELELVEDNEQRKRELLRRYTIEKLKMIENENKKVEAGLNDLFSSMGRGMAEAAAGAILMGESFKKSVVAVLDSLAKEALVQGLMETAKGTAMLLLNPAQAATHFKAAGIFAGAAVAAKSASSALGGSSGSGGGGGIGGGGSSAMGSPQSAPPPQREQARETEMVFNINFSGAVVYDTKRAAEQALADRVARVMNQRSRGGYRSM